MKLKWTIKRSLEVVYTGTLKNMTYYTGYAQLGTGKNLYGEGNCVNGFKVGEWTYYQGDKVIAMTESYDDEGLKQGESISYYKDGQIKSLSFYLNNQPVGKSYRYDKGGDVRRVTECDQKGNILYSTSFYPNGAKQHYEEYDYEFYKSGRVKKRIVKQDIWFKENDEI